MLNRRTMLVASAGTAAAAWAAPSVLSMSAAAAASGSGTCWTFAAGLDGWTANLGAAPTVVSDARGGGPAMFPPFASGAAGSAISPAVPWSVATPLPVSVEYCSDGGCGFIGVNAYATSDGSGPRLNGGDIWLFGATSSPFGQVPMAVGAVDPWASYDTVFGALPPGTSSIRILAETYTGPGGGPAVPSYFRSICVG